jgi:hypothetical protein
MPATEVLSMPIKQGCDPEKVLSLANDVPTIGKISSGFVNGKPNRFRAFLGSSSLGSKVVSRPLLTCCQIGSL